MKKPINIIIVLGAVLANLSAFAQVDTTMYRAYLNQDTTLWQKAITQINEHTYADATQKIKPIIEAQAGMLVYALAKQDEATFDKVSGQMEDNIETLLQHNKKDGWAHAMLSNLYGADIAFNNYKGAYLGISSSSHADKATKYSPEEAFSWFQQGNTLYFTPAMFGGDLEAAIRSFEKSVALFEQKGDTTQNWMYLNALAWLGKAYDRDGQTPKAIVTYQKALEIEPEFYWVKSQLLPKAEVSTQTHQ